jgi:DnaJ-class molecular chaperone
MNPINNKIYYDILNIEPYSDSDTIKKAYRRLSLRYHPDKNNDDGVMFNKITQAYELLIQNHSPSLPNNNTNSSSIEIYNPPTNDPNNEDIIINLNITFEDSYNGANVPINIKRSIFNNNIFKHEEERIYIPLPKSIDNNEIITINNKGNCINYKYSDIKIIIKLKEHEFFLRDGLNLIYFSNITFKQSLTGIDFNITHLNNKTYRITNTNREIIHNNTNIVLRNLGFQRDSFTGNLIIKFKIDYPKTLSTETILKLKEIL